MFKPQRLDAGSLLGQGKAGCYRLSCCKGNLDRGGLYVVTMSIDKGRVTQLWWTLAQCCSGRAAIYTGGRVSPGTTSFSTCHFQNSDIDK